MYVHAQKVDFKKFYSFDFNAIFSPLIPDKRNIEKKYFYEGNDFDTKFSPYLKWILPEKREIYCFILLS